MVEVAGYLSLECRMVIFLSMAGRVRWTHGVVGKEIPKNDPTPTTPHGTVLDAI